MAADEILFPCVLCRLTVAAPRSLSGHVVRCPRCDEAAVVPRAGSDTVHDLPQAVMKTVVHVALPQ